MHRWVLGAILALAVCGAAAVSSYAVLNHFYGGGYLITSTQVITIENGGQKVTMDDLEYDVADVGLSPDNADFYLLDLISRSYYDGNLVPLGGEGSFPASSPAPASYPITQISVPTGSYEKALSGEPATVSKTTSTESRPIDVLPIATSIGIAMGVVVLAAWAGYQQTWGGATSTLIEHGLRDMTVRDVEIVGCIMELKEFTIPELMRTTKASKITVWRTVQKLVEKEIVQQTEKTKLASGGLGGRGKPSSVYKYVGAEPKKK